MKLRSDTDGGGRMMIGVQRRPQKFTSVADYNDGGDARTVVTDTNDGHVDRTKVTFILAAISTGNAALTTAPAGGGKRTRLANGRSADRGRRLYSALFSIFDRVCRKSIFNFFVPFPATSSSDDSRYSVPRWTTQSTHNHWTKILSHG